jgi:hypothetical protein
MEMPKKSSRELLSILADTFGEARTLRNSARYTVTPRSAVTAAATKQETRGPIPRRVKNQNPT